GVREQALGVVDVFLVKRPADSLYGAALELPLDIGGMDRCADVLRRSVAADGNATGIGIDLQIAAMHAEARTSARDVELGMAVDRAAGLARLRRKLRQGQRPALADIA